MDHESEQPYLLARRKSFRCPLDDADFDSELRINQERYPVAVVDESSGGFGVLIEGPLPLKPDDSAWLRHRSGWSEVRVMHIGPEESPEAESPDGRDASPQRTRLGLKRLRELEVPDGLPQSPWAALCDLRAHMTWLLGSTLRTAAGGVIFAVLVVGIPAIVLATLFTGGRSALSRMLPESRWHERLAESAGPVNARPARRFSSVPAAGPSNRPRTERAPPSEPGAPSTPARSPAADPADSRSRPGAPAAELLPESMRETIRRLPGASPLVVPAVARYLGLTPAQQEQIASIVEQTTVALKELEIRFSGAGRQAMARYEAMLFDRARQQAEAVLNESQRVRWRELSGTPSPGESQPEEPALP